MLLVIAKGMWAVNFAPVFNWQVVLYNGHTAVIVVIVVVVVPPQPFYGSFSRTTRWPSARRELLDFMVQGKINRGRHTDHPAGRHSIRTKQFPSPPSPIFLQVRCPSCRQTNSVKALKELAHSDYGEDAGVLLSSVTCTVSVPCVSVLYTLSVRHTCLMSSFPWQPE